MAILLSSDDIPKYWEAIKYAVVQVNAVEEKDRERYLNKLLYLLLSSKAQCFFRLDEKRQLQSIGISRLTVDEITEKKSLNLECLYSFAKVDFKTVWLDDFRTVYEFAKNNNCDFITTTSSSEKLIWMAREAGLQIRSTNLIMEVT